MIETLTKTAAVLVLRGFIIAFFQFYLKRAMLAKKNEALLNQYGGIGAIEGLIFILIFSALHIISAATSRLHAEEIRAERDGNNAFDPKKIGELYQQGILFSFMLIAPVIAICIATPSYFKLTHQSDDLISITPKYFRYALIAYLLDAMYRSQARVMIGLSLSHYSLFADTTESVLDATFTYFLLNGKLGFPEMGVEAAAIGYAMAAGITVLGHTIFIYTRPALKKYGLFENQFKNALLSPQFKTVVSSGMHLSLSGCVIYLTQVITTTLCGLSGQAAMIGLQAAIAYDFLVTLAVNGFSEAANVLQGGLFKNKSMHCIKLGNLSYCVGLFMSIIPAVLLFMFMHSIASQFMDPDKNSPADFMIVKNFLYLQAFISIINSVVHVGSDILSACEETRQPFLLSVKCILILNSTLALTSYFFMSRNVLLMYGIQLIGFSLNSAGILNCWHKTKSNLHSLFNAMTPMHESPRNSGVMSELPGATVIEI